jgi:hypothetical protein
LRLFFHMYNRHELFWAMKICKRCNIEKPLNEFYSRKGEKDNKHRYCKICLKQENDSWYQNTKHQRTDYYQQYREKNKEYFNKYCHTHYHTKKELYREWSRNKYLTDNIYRTKKIVTVRIHEALNAYQALKKDRTIEYLGCTISEYCDYLESKFDSNMTWENQGVYWEIDHIRPISSFDLTDEEQLYQCFHYTNTQPLNKKENRLKSDTYI